MEQLSQYLDFAFPDLFSGPVEGFELFYADVNGDQVEDLIVGDELKVAILLWDGSQYQEGFKTGYAFWKYRPAGRVTLEDWTMDGVPEVVFDYRGDTGGTGYMHEI